MNSNSDIAKIGLLLNGAFSLGTGLLLAIAPAAVGGWLGVSIDGWLRLLGLALIGHFGLIMWFASRESLLPWLRLNFMMVAPYPLLMIVLVVTGLVDRGLGQGLVLADGAIVGLFALMQWTGLRGKGRESLEAQPAGS